MSGAHARWAAYSTTFTFLMSLLWRGCSPSAIVLGQAPSTMTSAPGSTFCAGTYPLKGRAWSAQRGTGEPASSFGDQPPRELAFCVLGPRLQSSNGWNRSLTALRGSPPPRRPTYCSRSSWVLFSWKWTRRSGHWVTSSEGSSG